MGGSARKNKLKIRLAAYAGRMICMFGVSIFPEISTFAREDLKLNSLIPQIGIIKMVKLRFLFVIEKLWKSKRRLQAKLKLRMTLEAAFPRFESQAKLKPAP